MLISLPEELKVLLVFLITQGLKALWNLAGKDFGGGAAAFAAVVVGAVLFFIDGLLALVPVEYQDAVAATLSFIVAILGAFGVHYSYRNIAK